MPQLGCRRMYRRCPDCSMDLPASAWKAHRRMYHQRRPGRKRNGSTTAWRKLRAEVIARDGGRCRSCGAKASQPGRPAEVHHVDGNWQNDSKENLVTLCGDCHDRQPGNGHGGGTPPSASRKPARATTPPVFPAKKSQNRRQTRSHALSRAIPRVADFLDDAAWNLRAANALLRGHTGSIA